MENMLLLKQIQNIEVFTLVHVHHLRELQFCLMMLQKHTDLSNVLFHELVHV